MKRSNNILCFRLKISQKWLLNFHFRRKNKQKIYSNAFDANEVFSFIIVMRNKSWVFNKKDFLAEKGLVSLCLTWMLARFAHVCLNIDKSSKIILQKLIFFMEFHYANGNIFVWPCLCLSIILFSASCAIVTISTSFFYSPS